MELWRSKCDRAIFCDFVAPISIGKHVLRRLALLSYPQRVLFMRHLDCLNCTHVYRTSLRYSSNFIISRSHLSRQVRACWKACCVRRSDDGCHLETITSSGCISCYLRWIVCENSTLFFQQTFVCSIYFYVSARRRKCLLFGLQPEISFNRIRKRFSSRWQTLQKSSPPRAVIIQMREKTGSSLARQAANQKFLIYKNKGSIGVRPQYAPPRALTL